jgi:hypothetical protein
MFDLEEDDDEVKFIQEEEYEDEDDFVGFSKSEFAPSGHVPAEPSPWDPYEFNFFRIQ